MRKNSQVRVILIRCPHESSIPESFFKLSSQRSLREECSHRSKGKPYQEMLCTLWKEGVQIHYLRCSKTENHQMQVTAWRLTTMDEEFSDKVFATADQAVGHGGEKVPILGYLIWYSVKESRIRTSDLRKLFAQVRLLQHINHPIVFVGI